MMNFSLEAFEALDVSPNLKSLVKIFNQEGFGIDFVRIKGGALNMQLTKPGCEKSLPEFISIHCPNPKTQALSNVQRREGTLDSAPTHTFSINSYLNLLLEPA